MILLWITTANAWDFVNNANRNYRIDIGMDYSIVENDFSALEVLHIVNGVYAWDNIPGSSYHPVFMGFNDASDAGLPCNGVNEIGRHNDNMFFFQGNRNSSAQMVRCPSVLGTIEDEDKDIDIGFREPGAGYSWCLGTPSTCAERPLAFTAMHEFGHFAGFNHENDVLSAMGGPHDYQGDLGGQIRISENDAAGLQANWPGGSTGGNLGLKKFAHFPWTSGWLSPTNGYSRELWTGQRSYTWDLSYGSWTNTSLVPVPGPEPVRAVYIGTGSQSSHVRWYLVSGDCDDTIQYTVGGRNPSMSTNTPYLIQPAGGYDLSAVPPGEYRLCVVIDPNDVVSETSETDNRVYSKRNNFIEVIP